MSKEKIEKRIGFLLIIFAILCSYHILTIREISGINFIIGLLFGMLMVRGEFSFSASMRNPILKKDYRFTSLLWQMTVMTSFGISLVIILLDYYSVFEWEHFLHEPTEVSLYFCFSGIVFGFGLSFLGSAASGIIKKFSNANIGFIVAVLFYFPGSVCGVIVREWAISKIGEYRLFMPEIFGWGGAFVVQFLLFLIIFVIVHRGVAKYGEYVPDAEENVLNIAISDLPTTTKAKAVVKELFLSEIQANRGIILIALISVIYFAFNQKLIAASMPLSLFGYKFLYSLGFDLPSLFQSLGLTKLSDSIMIPILENPQLTMILGYSLGTIIIPFWKGKYMVKPLKSFKKSLIMILGGFFVGFGVQGMYGANIGEIYGAISMMSLSGWIIIPFICLGIYIGKPIFLYLSVDKNHPNPS